MPKSWFGLAMWQDRCKCAASLTRRGNALVQSTASFIRLVCPPGGVIQLKTPEMVARTFSPKVDGTYVLDSLLKEEHLDFFVLCSSLASELGGAGQVDYCAANAFQDSYAQFKARQNGTRVVSIGWDKWEDVGMAVKARQIWPKSHKPTDPEDVTDDHNYLPANHPLLDRYCVRGDEIMFVVELDAAKHWILSEHSIYDTPTVEGTAYVEMLRAAFEQLGTAGQAEIRDLLFLTPFAVRHGETKNLQLVFRREEDGYNFCIRSKSGENGHATWQEHAIGRIGLAAASPGIKHKLHEIIERCRAKEITTFHHREANNTENPIALGPRWKCTKKVNIGTDEGLADYLELPSEFSADLDEYKDTSSTAGHSDECRRLSHCTKRILIPTALVQTARCEEAFVTKAL